MTARSLARERDRIARAIGLIVMSVAPAGAVSAACDLSSDSAAVNDASTDVAVADVVADDSNVAADVNGDEVSCAISSTIFDSGHYFDADAEAGVIDLSCTYQLPCGLPPTLVAVGCDILLGEPDSSPDAFVPIACAVPEGMGCTDGSLTPGANGALGMTCLDCFGSGRRPRGVRRSRVDAKDAFGSYLASMAHAEAVSVHAFARMEQELAQFCAPRHLRFAAARARREETRHARIMSRLAHERGANVKHPSVRAFGERSLEAMAVENAVEGCVNETFGAVMLAWQATHASDAKLRNAFTAIARDEAKHAALSWAVANWAEKQLDPRANHRIRRARDRAVQALRASMKRSIANDFSAIAGLPGVCLRNDLLSRTVSMFALDSLARPA